MKPNLISEIFFNLLIGFMAIISVFNFRLAIKDKKKITELIKENESLKKEILCLKAK